MNDSTLVRVAPRGPAETMRHDEPRRRLTLLSAAERRYCEPLLRGFAERHPEIDVDFVFGISTDLHRRYLQEAAAGGATSDLIWSSAMDQVMELVLGGHAQPHGVHHTLPANAAYRDLAVATTCEPLFTLCRDPSLARRLAGGDRRAYRCRPAALSRRHRGPGYRDQRPWLPRDAALERGAGVRRISGCAGIVPASRRRLRACADCRGDGSGATRAPSPGRLCVARCRRQSVAAYRANGGARDGGRACGVHSPPRGESGSRIDVPGLLVIA